MREVVRWTRAVAPDMLRGVAVAAIAVLLAVAAGVGPSPGVWQALLVLAGLGLIAGDCFSTAGPDSGLRYATPCGAAHAGEVYFVGRLPLVHNPGPRATDAVARAVCEKPYGEYLGVPFGQSYLPLEAPLRAEAGSPGTARFGVGCLDGDAAHGYGVAIAPDGSVEVWKQVGTQRSPLAAGKPKRVVKPGTAFDAHITCAVRPDGVDVSAVVAGTAVRAADRTQPVLRRASPRLLVEAGDAAPAAVAVAAFTATLG